MTESKNEPERVSRRGVLRLGAGLAGFGWSTKTTRARTVAADDRTIACGTPYFGTVGADGPDRFVFRRNGRQEALFVINCEDTVGKLSYDIESPSGADLASGTLFSERTAWDYAFPYVSLDEPGDYEMRVSAETAADESIAYYVYRYCDHRRGSGPPLVGPAETRFAND